MTSRYFLTLLILFLSSAPLVKGWADTAPATGGEQTVETACLGLTSGPLRLARLAHLPDKVIFRSPSVQVTHQELTAEIDKAPEQVRGQLRKNAFFLLEQLATRKLLLEESRKWAAAQEQIPDPGSDDSLIRSYLQSLTQGVTVSDEEVKRFYDQNKDLVGGAPFEKVRADLRVYLLGEKQQEAVGTHIATLGQRTPLEVDEAWTKQQCKLALDNPVDQARRSGKPSLVDFGATGCGPCDMMTPILASLKEKYQDKLTVLFVHVNEEQVLAARYGVRGIPVQIFFDKEGKEVFRHAGFLAQEAIEAKLAEMGVMP